jgi:hypothetical protein
MPSANTKTSVLVKYLALQAQKLRVDLQAARLFVGTTNVGNVAENAVRRFLRSILPERYSIGVGEAIAPNGGLPLRVEQTQQKDVLIYDPYGSTAFGWDESGINLFPVESIYGVIEVKTNISSQDEFLFAVDQTLEVKKLCKDFRPADRKSPFTGVFVFESKVAGNTLFNTLKKRAPEERADFMLILKPASASRPDSSLHFAHWHYYSRGSGPIRFTTADETAEEIARDSSNRDKFLTIGETENALIWFYLFLIEQLDSMELIRPNLWQYAQAIGLDLGWRNNE